MNQLSKEVDEFDQIESDVGGLPSTEYEQRVLRVKADPINDDLFAELVLGANMKQRAQLIAHRNRALEKLARLEAKEVRLEDQEEKLSQKQARLAEGLSSEEMDLRVQQIQQAPGDQDLYEQLTVGMTRKQRQKLIDARTKANAKLAREEREQAKHQFLEETKAVKDEAKKYDLRYRRQDQFSGRERVNDLAAAYPFDIYRQMMALLAVPIIAAIGSKREVSEKTQTEYRKTLTAFLDQLRQLNMLPSNLRDLGRVHAIEVIRSNAALGKSTSVMQNLISRLRRLYTLMGRKDAVPGTPEIEQILGVSEANGKTVKVFKRDRAADKALTWDANGVDLGEMLAKVSKVSAHTSLLLELQAAFGLRVKESIMLQPAYAIKDGVLHVIKGTKGGRSRNLKLSTDADVLAWQLDVIERAKQAAAQRRDGSMGYPDLSLKSAQGLYYRHMHAAGLTRKGVGVTSHGLRHQYACRRYEDLMDSPPPVSGVNRRITPEFKRDDLSARLVISEELGHSRPEITTGYCGSTHKLEMDIRRAIRDLEAKTAKSESFGQLLRDFQIRNCWVGGNLGAGITPREGEPVQFLMEFESAAAIEQTKALNLRHRLQEAVKGDAMFLMVPFGTMPMVDVLEVTPWNSTN